MSMVRFTHIGGPTMLIDVDGWRLLTDPTFDAPGRRYTFGWGTASRKQVGPAIAVDDLPPIDAVLLSHDQHADNLDDAGRALLASVGHVLTTVPAARRLGANAEGLRPWASTRLSAEGRTTVDVIATPARHGPPLSRPIVGVATGFALRWPGQEHGVLWISGDTVRFRGLDEVARRLDVGTAVVHLGGVRFPASGPVRYTMTARPAAQLLESMKPQTVIPVHYEGWSHFAEGRDAIEQALLSAPEAVRSSVRWLPIGEPTSVAV